MEFQKNGYKVRDPQFRPYSRPTKSIKLTLKLHTLKKHIHAWILEQCPKDLLGSWPMHFPTVATCHMTCGMMRFWCFNCMLALRWNGTSRRDYWQHGWWMLVVIDLKILLLSISSVSTLNFTTTMRNSWIIPSQDIYSLDIFNPRICELRVVPNCALFKYTEKVASSPPHGSMFTISPNHTCSAIWFRRVVHPAGAVWLGDGGADCPQCPRGHWGKTAKKGKGQVCFLQPFRFGIGLGQHIINPSKNAGGQQSTSALWHQTQDVHQQLCGKKREERQSQCCSSRSRLCHDPKAWTLTQYRQAGRRSEITLSVESAPSDHFYCIWPGMGHPWFDTSFERASEIPTCETKIRWAWEGLFLAQGPESNKVHRLNWFQKNT